MKRFLRRPTVVTHSTAQAGAGWQPPRQGRRQSSMASFRTLAIALLCAGVMSLLTLSFVAAQSVPKDVPNPPVITDTDDDTGEVIEILAGNEQLTVTWTAPGSDGGSAITGYKVQWKSGDEDYDATTRQSPTTGDDALDENATSYVISDDDLSNDDPDPLTNGTAYTVQVIAVNAEGDSNPSDEATGTPVGPPTAPRNVTVAAGNEQLTVTWDAPDNNGGSAITGYRVQWKLGSDSTYTEGMDVDADDRSYTITGLENNSGYTVQVRATNDDDDIATTGDGAWSADVAGQPISTLGAAPAAPGNVKVAADHEQLVVTWAAPDSNPAITGYVVQWKSGGNDYDDPVPTSTADNTAVLDAADAMTHTISDLTNGTEYTVRVRAVNNYDDGAANTENDGAGSWSAGVTGTPAGVPEAPAAPTLADGYAQLAVSWNEAVTTGREAVTSYKVQWKSGDEAYNASNQKTVIAPSEEAAVPTEYVITGLTNDTPYTVRVIATNDAGDSLPSAEATEMPSASENSATDVPEAPAAAPTLTAGNEQLMVSWTASDPQRAVVTGYKVQWKFGSHGYEDSASGEQPVDAETIEYMITGLENGTEYTVRVLATSAAGDSPPSDDQTGTPAAVPTAPGNVEVAAYHEQLVVTWDASTAGGTDVTGYKVQWKSGDEGYDTSRQETLTGDDVSSYTIDAGAAGDNDTVDATVVNDTEYTVRVLATSAVGDSLPSDPQTGTPAAVPDAPALAGNPVEAGYEQLTVSWTASDTNDREDVTGYKVQWKSGDEGYDGSDGSTRQAIVDADADPLSYTILSLENDAPYMVQVIAVNDEGDSPPSTEANGMPSASENSATDVPEAPAAAPTLTAGNEQLTVSWTASNPQRAVVTGYKVQWKSGTQDYDGSDGSTRQAPVAADADPLSYTILSLENDTPYMVQVIATSAAGDSLPSDPQTGTPAAAVNQEPGAPDNVMVTAGYQQLTVAWDESANKGAAVAGYTVQWKSGSHEFGADAVAGEVGAATVMGAATTSYTIMGLANSTEYMVRVQATSIKVDDDDVADTSEWSDTAMGTPLALPDAPVVSSIEADNGQLTVSWTAPEAYGEAITGYTVQWKSGEQDYDASRQATVADVMTYAIGGLDNGTAYTVQVRATNANGDGPWSAEMSGAPVAPPAPEPPPPVVETKTVVETRTVDRVVYRTRSAPAPAPAPQPTIIGDSGYATTYLAVDGQSIELRVHPQAGGPASHNFAIGSYIRDADLGQTYQIVAGGKRRWVSPGSPLVYAIPWAVVNSQHTHPTVVVAAIPLDESSPPDGFLVRGQNGRIVSYSMAMWRHVPNIPTFQALGYRWCDVNAADAGFFSRISEGAAHPATSQAARADYPVCG